MDFTKFCTTSRKRKEEPVAAVPVEKSSSSKSSRGAEGSVKQPAQSVQTSGDESAVPDTAQNFNDFVVERKIPIANQIDLTGHTKAVACISIEPAGNRVVTGSYDYAAKMYDFGGMDSRHRAFQSVEVQEGQMVVSVSHSPSGDRFIVATGSPQPKVYDRDGKEIIKFVRGDMYLRDLSNTKGHTMEVTCVQWHPTEKDVVLTCSLDGSMRIWDLQGETTFGTLVNKHVLKVKPATGNNRLGLHSCCYSPTGNKVAGGAADGSVHVFNEKKIYSRADLVLRHDACAQREITGVAFAKDGTTLVARSVSGHVLLWDVQNERTAKTPLKVLSGLPNDYPTANVAFSPDGSLLCCGTSPIAIVAPTGSSKSGAGLTAGSSSNSGDSAADGVVVDTAPKSRLCFYDVKGPATAPCLSIAVEAGATVIMVRWHPVTNQILCTLSSGVTRVFYDPAHSKKGALLSANKAAKRVHDLSDFAAVGEIYNPLALPMYRTDMPGDRKKKREELKDPYLAKIPENKPAGGPGTRPNTNFFFTDYVMKDRVVDKSRAEDPREVLLRVDAEARADPKFMGSAYAATQPKAQLHTMTFEEEQEEFRKRQKKL